MGVTVEGLSTYRAMVELEWQEERERLQELGEWDAHVLELVRKAGVMPRYEHAEHPLAAQCVDDIKHGRNVYICGGVGTGKTYLASAVVRGLVETGTRVRFTSMGRVLDAIKDSFNGGGNPLPAIQNIKVLVLDDLGKETPTSFALERMFALVDERNARMLPTIVTTQYEPSKLINRLASHGDVETATAIVSRLRQDSRKVTLSGGDRRRGAKRQD